MNPVMFGDATVKAMRRFSNARIVSSLFVLFAGAVLASPRTVTAQAKPSSGNASILQAVGTIKSLQTDSIKIDAESGEVTAQLTAATKILRVPPGEKDLKNATALQVQDLQPGDRILVRGQAGAQPKTITALAIIVMKQADVSAQHDREREDWQKRGVDGLVSKVDAAAGTITISSGGLAAKKNVVIQAGKNTVLRRYAPDSVKFDDAKPAPLDQVKVGDQLRARGTRTPDGNELAAEEIVWGSFRNIAGTITAVDASNNTLTVRDVIAKAPVTVRVASDSQIKKLPPEMAQRFAARLKGGASGNGDHPANAQNRNAQDASAVPPSPDSGAGQNGGARRGSDSQSPGGPRGGPGGNGPPDLQRLLSHLPGSKLADLQKGDAVVILSTEGGEEGKVTAIQLVAGVEPILTAAPSRSLLSPWSLNASGGEGESAP
jgi:co-chaperonin GroES (HSP10)